MATVEICIEGEFPTYGGLYQLFKDALMKLFDPNFTFPDPNYRYPLFEIDFPETLTITKDMFGELFYSPTMFIVKYVNALTQEFIFMIFKIILDILEPLLGAIPLPKIPCLNIDLLDILAGNLGDVHTTCSCGPKTASNLDAASMKAPANVADCITGYLKTLVELFVGKLQDLIDYIKNLFPAWTAPGLPDFSELLPIPTKADIIAMIPAVTPPPIPGYTIGDVVVPPLEIPASPTLDSLMNATIPGIPSISALIPNPILEYSKPGTFEIEEAINAILQKLTMLPLQLLVDFLNEILDILGLSIVLPTLCFQFPVIDL